MTMMMRTKTSHSTGMSSWGPIRLVKVTAATLCFASTLPFILLHINASPLVQQCFGYSMRMCNCGSTPASQTVSASQHSEAACTADEGGEPPPLRRSQRRCNYVYQNKNERPGHRERELESTIRIQAK